MTWFIITVFVIAVLGAVLLPLLRTTKVPDTQRALDQKKQDLADQLERLEAQHQSGDINDEEYSAEKTALQTDAEALLREADEIEGPIINDSPEGRRLRLVVGVLVLLVAANVVGVTYFLMGTWKHDDLVAGHAGQGQRMDGGPVAGANADPNQMVANLEARLRDNPDDPRGQAMLARSYLVLERYEDAFRTYQTAVSLNPDDTSVHVGMGVSALRAGRADAARGAFAKALELSPDNIDALWFTGMVKIHDGDIEGAKASWGRLLEITPAESREEMRQHIEDVLEAMAGQGMPPAEGTLDAEVEEAPAY